MKSLMVFSLVLFFGGCNFQPPKETMNQEKIVSEIKGTFSDFMEASNLQDIEAVMSFYDDTTTFRFITEDQVIESVDEMRVFYNQLFDSLDSIQVIENNLQVMTINSEWALSTWDGKEKIWMKDQPASKMQWLNSVVFRKANGEWKISWLHAFHQPMD